METSDPLMDSISLSVEKIIDVIRSVRDDLIKEHLQDEKLSYYYKEKFRKELTNVKKEFLKRDLKELLIAPVDLAPTQNLSRNLRRPILPHQLKRTIPFFMRSSTRIFSKYSF